MTPRLWAGGADGYNRDGRGGTDDGFLVDRRSKTHPCKTVKGGAPAKAGTKAGAKKDPSALRSLGMTTNIWSRYWRKGFEPDVGVIRSVYYAV